MFFYLAIEPDKKASGVQACGIVILACIGFPPQSGAKQKARSHQSGFFVPAIHASQYQLFFLNQPQKSVRLMRFMLNINELRYHYDEKNKFL